MSISRRSFLRNALAGAIVGAVAGPELVELLTPKRTIFLPPRGGWDGYKYYYVDPKLMAELLVRPMISHHYQTHTSWGEREGWPVDQVFSVSHS